MSRSPPVPKQSQSPGPRNPLKKHAPAQRTPQTAVDMPDTPKDPSPLEIEVDNWVEDGGAGGEVRRARDAKSAAGSSAAHAQGKVKPAL